MKTTIDIDHQLLQEAMNLTGEPTKVAMIHRALTELVRREKSMKILEHGGKLDLSIDLDAVRGRNDALRTHTILKKQSEIRKYRGKLDLEGDLDSQRLD
ncbi:MAG: type II toxin-antitoxin system VapB family antitoxin [Fibrobacteres bacterium]|nr:type II toxin-antitoxin system VapB family antitoxin [Fibrobacterota bacterium]